MLQSGESLNHGPSRTERKLGTGMLAVYLGTEIAVHHSVAIKR